MMVGLVRPDSGQVTFDGEDITAMPMYQRARRGIGYLAQEPSVFRKLTVEQNVLAILETLPITPDERHERLDHLLDEALHQNTCAKVRRTTCSGRAPPAGDHRALVTSPKFMLLDEPFAGVDPIAVHDIQTIVAGLRKRGIGVLITDHNVEQTLDIVDRAYIGSKARCRWRATCADLVNDQKVADLYLGPRSPRASARASGRPREARSPSWPGDAPELRMNPRCIRRMDLLYMPCRTSSCT